ncbi:MULTISPECIES: hypothetical protein, partial [unclassified Streptomyces]|uniref:hypothetical protein n=1 Tax=unclassified Streptomyces TaxID=2593676 RepID=UPI00081E9A39
MVLDAGPGFAHGLAGLGREAGSPGPRLRPEPGMLWLVVDGEADAFAVGGPDGTGRWHALGRL